MSDTSTKRALEVAKFHEVSEELYADNPEDSGSRAMHHISANLLRDLAAERDMWRAENIKKQTACEQMGVRIAAFETEIEKLREALRPFIQTGNVQVGYRVKLDGQEPPPITASEEEAWAHYGGSEFHYQQWLQWRAVQIGRELLGEKQ